jgi:four helix bundle protein
MLLSYRDLNVWQNAMNLVEDVYKITANFPKEEKYGLISQIRRCSVSIPSNISEGFMRKSTKEYIQFIYIIGLIRRIGHPDGNSC